MNTSLARCSLLFPLLLCLYFLFPSPVQAGEVNLKTEISRALRPGNKGEVTIRAHNNSKKLLIPGALVVRGTSPSGKKLTLGAQKYTLGKRGKVVKSKGKPDRIITGFRLWREDIGPQARAPQRKREILGKEKFVALGLLPQGKTLKKTFYFRVPARMKGMKVKVTFLYFHLPEKKKFQFYKKIKSVQGTPRKKSGQPYSGKLDNGEKKSNSRRWILTMQSLTIYRALTEKESLASLEKCLVAASDYNKLKGKRTKADQKVTIWPLSFTLADGKDKAGLKKVEKALYYIPLDCWVMERKGRTYFTSWKMVRSFRGNFVDLAKKLNYRYSINIKIFSYEEKKDPQGKAKALRERGIPVKIRPVKGGQYSGVAKVKAHRLADFLEIWSRE